MTQVFLRAVERARLIPSKVTLNVMRYTAITPLVRASLDLSTIRKISGHETLAKALRYIHVHGQHIDTAVAAISSAFPDAITPELHTPANEQSGDVAALHQLSGVRTGAWQGWCGRRDLNPHSRGSRF